ncbi:MAG TPA: hypothetical protein VFA19_17285 [Gaiellaceae bacterium]|nr:hypothetical protein [Gaiellaceae bacterium]
MRGPDGRLRGYREERRVVLRRVLLLRAPDFRAVVRPLDFRAVERLAVDFRADERLAVDFFAVERFAVERFAVERLAVERFAVDFFAVERLAVDFFAVERLAVDFFAVERLAVERFAVDFFAVERLAVDFFAVDFFALERLAVDRFAVDFFALDFFAPVDRVPLERVDDLVLERDEERVRAGRVFGASGASGTVGVSSGPGIDHSGGEAASGVSPVMPVPPQSSWVIYDLLGQIACTIPYHLRL